MKIANSLKEIQSKLPTWFKMRRSQKSVGARFLNVMGLSIDDVDEILEYAYQNQYLVTADVTQADVIYKAPLPAGINPSLFLTVTSNLYELQPAPNLEQFLTAFAIDRLNHREVYYENPYYIDYERNLIYTRKNYDVDAQHPEGQITLKVYDSDRRLLTTEVLKLSLHHVWNFFDEFGLILDTPRLYGESNADYKKRLMDVFRHPANSSKEGLYNGIARELGLTREVEWLDGGRDLVLKDARVRLSSIEVDGVKWPTDSVFMDESDRTVLRGDISYEGVARIVTYTYGLTMHELHDTADLAFQTELFDVDGHATAMLQYYVDIINDKVPVNWGQFVWGVGYWDTANPDMSGYGFIPTFYDANFSGWSKYKAQE